jgi:hypothetical protein
VVKLTGIPAEIRIGHLSSTSQKLYVQTAAKGAPTWASPIYLERYLWLLNRQGFPHLHKLTPRRSLSGNLEVFELSGDWGYKRATLSSGYINTVAWSSTLAVGVRLKTSPRSHTIVENLVRRVAGGITWQQLDIITRNWRIEAQGQRRKAQSQKKAKAQSGWRPLMTMMMMMMIIIIIVIMTTTNLQPESQSSPFMHNCQHTDYTDGTKSPIRITKSLSIL